MPKKIEIEKLHSVIVDHFDLFICSSSFEDRCLSIALHIPTERIGCALICANRDYEEHIKDNLDKLIALFPDNYFVADVYTTNPLASADSIEALLQQVTIKGTMTRILIDITTFTHEMVLIVLAILQSKYSDAKITCCYTNAKEYSYDQENQRDKWLSKGVGEVRTILGYPGIIKPSRQTHLIVIVGYEYERAVRIIESLEPDSLSLGYGLASDATTDKNHGANEQFAKLVKDMSAFYDGIIDFIVPCNSPFDAFKAIISEVNRHENRNIVIVPMNNKISTLGAALACNTNNEIQLCYAPALIYNYRSYSISGNKCYLFDWPI